MTVKISVKIPATLRLNERDIFSAKIRVRNPLEHFRYRASILGIMQNEPAGNPAPNWPLLAGMRFLLAMIVVAYHVQITIGGVSQHLIDMDARAAVYGFLVLSGYSISHSLRANTRGYYWRRFWRIYPVYFVCLAGAVLLHYGHGAFQSISHPDLIIPPTTHQVVSNLFFLNGITSPNIGTIAVAWTLSCEVMFYLIAPLLVRLDIRGCIALYAISLFTLYEYCAPIHYDSLGTSPLIPVSLLFYWMAGWTFYRYPKNPASFIMLLGPPMAIHPQSCGQLGWFTFLIVTMTLIYSREINISPMGARIGVWLGDLSFPLYLSHWQIIWLYQRLNLLSGEDDVSLMIKARLIGGMFLAGILLLYLVDRPCRKLSKVALRVWEGGRRRREVGAIAANSFSNS